ncbi:ABC transporter permease [Flavihumibacter petaseus]|uniref:Putative ABC transporter permease protein n=1 Tax=Flavihumibacter petaseus NBRC 106054 TaxID=1220578 RepID=A0A0E9N6D2_9BACT|nr:ABC transporter permease [Flavihumibacter petaseus]GAO45369.1 putative ABC transporter permease protein [Flavihumibacter petaseus NBRC 106054]
MLQNYFKIAWRNLTRNKGFALTNLLGLTIGISCTIFILLWVQDELTYDKFHANYNNTYKVMANRNFNNQMFTDPNMVFPLADALEKEIPEIKHATVVTYPQPRIFEHGDTKLKKEGYTVNQKFFNVFTWKFLEGNAATALNDPSSIILTESMAKAFFGNTSAVGKTIRVDNDRDAKITAVVADPPGNSTLRFDYLNTFNYSDEDTKRNYAEWTNSSWAVYITTSPGTNLPALDKKITALKLSHDPNDKAISTYFTFPMKQWRLYNDFKDGKNTGGLIEYVRLFSIIAVIILLIACVNFMNLSTARSERRAKEVGIRKTLGSDKKQLIFQFFIESVILAFSAFILSLLAVYLLMPAFNTLVDKHLHLDITQARFWIASAAIISFTGIIAGSYPALYLSSFNPIAVLKGSFLAGKNASLPRHVLVVGQFIISILLISATIIVYRQIEHIRNRDIGYNPNNLIMIPTSGDIQKNYEVIKQELLKTGNVASVTRTFSPITNIWWKSPAPDWEGKPDNLQILFAGMSADVDFTKTMGIKMLEGKDFSGMPSDSGAMLLNKAAIDAMGIKDPIGKQMRYGPRTYTVIGITDNVVMESPFNPVDPMMVYYNPNNINIMSIRLKPGSSVQQSIKMMEGIFTRHNPTIPFEYQFVDQEFGKKFVAEELISKLTNIFAGLAIFICCLGLAGLASFTIEKRFREIGIRKVLGASVGQVLLLISRDFLKLVLIAFLIAVPFAWWGMHNWLEKYTFHINISLWLFLAVGGIVLLLTLVVVSLNTLRAATSNPVSSLRSE